MISFTYMCFKLNYKEIIKIYYRHDLNAAKRTLKQHVALGNLSYTFTDH